MVCELLMAGVGVWAAYMRAYLRNESFSNTQKQLYIINSSKTGYAFLVVFSST